jgi:acyl dehydratase
VIIGDTIKCEAEVVKMFKKGESKGILAFDVRILNQRNEKVLIYIEKVLVSRRSTDKNSKKIGGKRKRYKN